MGRYPDERGYARDFKTTSNSWSEKSKQLLMWKNQTNSSKNSAS